MTGGRVKIVHLAIVAALLPARLIAQQPPGTGVRTLPGMQITATYRDSIGRWPETSRRVVLDSLAEGRLRWNARRPLRYRVAVNTMCGFCGGGWNPIGTRPAFFVTGDSIVRVTSLRDTLPNRFARWEKLTIDGVFRLVEKEANDRTRQLHGLVLDPYYGFPTAWEVDDVRNGYGMYMSDQGYWGAVEMFAPEVAGRCSFWRRVVRRCGP
jgi:hypothetical protein